MISIFVLCIGFLALVKMQSQMISGNSTAKQHSEATTLVEQKIEELRSYANTSNNPGQATYNAIVTADDTIEGSNAIYNRVWIITPNTSLNSKNVTVTVSWNDQTDTKQSITETTTIAEIDPGASGEVLTNSLNSIIIPGADSNSTNSDLKKIIATVQQTTTTNDNKNLQNVVDSTSTENTIDKLRHVLNNNLSNNNENVHAETQKKYETHHTNDTATFSTSGIGMQHNQISKNPNSELARFYTENFPKTGSPSDTLTTAASEQVPLNQMTQEIFDLAARQSGQQLGLRILHNH
jgi:Tfp pilus assembly protein PilV